MRVLKKLKKQNLTLKTDSDTDSKEISEVSVDKTEKKTERPKKKIQIITKKTKLPIIVKKRTKIKYKRQRCAFVEKIDTSGELKQCENIAIGKGTLCKRHGGDPVIKENLLDKTQEKYFDYPNSKFNPLIHPIQYIEMSRFGASDVEIAAQFEVSLHSIKRWAELYESFNTAYEVGKAMHEAWWLTQGKDNLNERSFNTHLFKYLTMNKLGYSDKIEQKNLNMNVHGVLAVPEKVSVEEWEADEEIIDVNS